MLELNFSQTLGNHCLTINETLPANGITAIFGVSGAGKTSLINAISGLTRPQKGRIVLNGRVLNDAEKGICLTPEKRRVGYVFQDARLFPHYKVAAWEMMLKLLPANDTRRAVIERSIAQAMQHLSPQESK